MGPPFAASSGISLPVSIALILLLRRMLPPVSESIRPFSVVRIALMA